MTNTSDGVPVYTPNHPPVPDTAELRARIPGWGADLDKEDRPSVPKLKAVDTGARWDFPERQPENWPRERSVEHRFLTPVFGTAQPPRGLAGVIRKFAYARYSEGRAAHWLILLLADRVDAGEHHLTSLLSLHPDNPITQTGIKAELTHNGFRARFGQGRVDLKHAWMDPFIVAGPWMLAGMALAKAFGLVRSRRGPRNQPE
jgi:hypothetical protein